MGNVVPNPEIALLTTRNTLWQRQNQKIYLVKLIVFGAISDYATPGPIGLDGIPEVSEIARGIGIAAEDVDILAQELLYGVPGGFGKGFIDIADDTFFVGLNDEKGVVVASVEGIDGFNQG